MSPQKKFRRKDAQKSFFFFDILEYYVLLEKGKGTLLGNLSLFPDVFFFVLVSVVNFH